MTNSGEEAYPNDGGDTTVHFYYDQRWRILEERDGSDQVLRQNVWGTRYTDELICIDVNGDPTAGDDCNPDVADPNDAEPDARYFVHQDRNWNVVALTAYSPDPNDPNWPVNGAVVERYSQTPYGSFTVLEGADSAGREGNTRIASLVGNAFVHQGLPFDAEKLSYQNRWREYFPSSMAFGRPDPLTTNSSPLLRTAFGLIDAYLYADGTPLVQHDPLGLSPAPSTPLDCYNRYGPCHKGRYAVECGRCVCKTKDYIEPDDPCPTNQHRDCESGNCEDAGFPSNQGDVYGSCCGGNRDCGPEGCGVPSSPGGSPDCSDTACSDHDQCYYYNGAGPWYPFLGMEYTDEHFNCDCALVTALAECDNGSNPGPDLVRRWFCSVMASNSRECEGGNCDDG